MIAVPVGKIRGVSRVAQVCRIAGNSPVLDFKMRVWHKRSILIAHRRVPLVSYPRSSRYLLPGGNSRPDTIQVPVKAKLSIGMSYHDYVTKIRSARIYRIPGSRASIAKESTRVHNESQLHNSATRGIYRVADRAARALRTHIDTSMILAENRAF